MKGANSNTINPKSNSKGGNMKVLFISNYENRNHKENLKHIIKGEYDNKPTEVMKERYKEILTIIKEYKQTLYEQPYDIHQRINILDNQLTKKLNHKLMKQIRYAISNKQLDKKLKTKIAKEIYRKVTYWNIYNNYNRKFVVYLDLDKQTYQTSKSTKLNIYNKTEVEMYIKALLQTNAIIKFKTTNTTLIFKTPNLDKGNWEDINFQYNQLIGQLIDKEDQECYPQPIENNQRYEDRFNHYLENYEDIQLDTQYSPSVYDTVKYHNYKYTITKEAIERIKYFKKNNLLEKKQDLDEIEDQLEYLKNKIKNTYPTDKDKALELFKQYEELAAQSSREYAIENQSGYMDILSADPEEDVETVVLNHLDNEEIEKYKVKKQ
jgi:hypothetical protein